MDKLAVMHSGAAGNKRRKCPNQRHKAGDGNRLTAVLVEESLRLLQFVAIDQPSKPAIASGCCLTNALANFIIDGVANNRSSQKDGEENPHIQVIRGICSQRACSK